MGDASGRRRSSRLSHQWDDDENNGSPPISPLGSSDSSTNFRNIFSSFKLNSKQIGTGGSDGNNGSYEVSLEPLVFLRPPRGHKHGERDSKEKNTVSALLCQKEVEYCCMSEDLLNTVVCQEAYVGTAASDVKRAVALAEVWKLRIFPTDYRPPEGASIPCSLLYGVNHFIRLIVKLPELLSHLMLSDEEMVVISKHVNHMAKFIAEYETEIFAMSNNYVPAQT